MVQAVPLPYVGTSNIPLHKRLKLSQEYTKNYNLVVGNAKRSDGDKEVEQPEPVDAIPLRSIPPSTTFKRKRQTRALVSIPEVPVSPPKATKVLRKLREVQETPTQLTSKLEQSKTPPSSKRRKAFIPDSDDETVGPSGVGRVTRSLHQLSLPIILLLVSPSHETLIIIKLIIEDNPDSMVDLNQVGNPGDSIEPPNLDSSPIMENPVDLPLAIPEVLSSKSPKAPTSQVKSLSSSLLEFWA
ncbi:hypothetical protein RHGRI_001619 [Rhododendron griersonianum]|uniref:Uncharacterized protein n=1 Tax=Rhododendron griersonianum TaxID=479676 RepID=A0AAV6LLE3_9ERIC|nr:hypothetical protein RHGRI_001619 [Rhododendron griersonianum]